MASQSTLTRALAVALLGGAMLAVAACSRPTPASPDGGGAPTTGDEGAQTSPYDVTSVPATTDPNAPYPPPTEAPTPLPEGYVGPGTEAPPGSAASESTAEPAAGDATVAPEATATKSSG